MEENNIYVERQFLEIFVDRIMRTTDLDKLKTNYKHAMASLQEIYNKRTQELNGKNKTPIGHEEQ